MIYSFNYDFEIMPVSFANFHYCVLSAGKYKGKI